MRMHMCFWRLAKLKYFLNNTVWVHVFVHRNLCPKRMELQHFQKCAP